MTDRDATLHDDGAWRDGRIGLLVIGAFFGVFGLWAALAPLDAAVVAAGEVKVAGSRQVVQHQTGGVITRIAVGEGARVERGQILIELSAVELGAQERSLSGQAIELEASRERLRAEAAGVTTLARPQSWSDLPPEHRALAELVLARQQAELSVRREAISAQQAVLMQRQRQGGARIDGHRAQIASIDAQSALIGEELRGLRTLSEAGFAAPSRVRAVERTEAELVGRRAELGGQIEQARESIGEARMQSLQVREERAQRVAEELRQTETQLANVLPQLQAVRTQLERTRVRAPTSGAVVGLAFFNVGAVVGPGEKMLELVPDEQDMILEVQVRPLDADNLRPGQNTQVRISAFEGRQLPAISGTVTQVSADRFEDPRSGQSYFKADVRVAEREIDRLAEASGRRELALSPGLPVEVVVPLRSRTALQYLLEPLGQTLWRSFREN